MRRRSGSWMLRRMNRTIKTLILALIAGLSPTAAQAATLSVDRPCWRENERIGFAVAKLQVTMSPAKARPSTTVTFRAQGFIEGGALYAHYIYSRSQTSKKHVK